MTAKRAQYLSVAVIVLYWVAFAASRLLRSDHTHRTVNAIAVNVCVRAAVVTVLVWFLMRTCGESIRDLGLAPGRTGHFLARTGLLAAGLFVVSNVVLNNLFSALFGYAQVPPIAELFRDPRQAPLWIFSAIVGGGFAEELGRAFVLTRFEKAFGRPGLVFAFVADSLVFGLGHLYQGNASALTTVFTGALLALVFLWRRRVIDAMAVHALFDLMGIAAAYALNAR
jgi:membrane protease YdiL (CAAX protease family)